MLKARFFLKAVFVLLTVELGYGFEIAIDGDPLSRKNDAFLWLCGNRTWQGTREQDSSSTIGVVYTNHLMDAAYHWYEEMGITKVMVNYIYPDNFNAIPADIGTQIKVMNWNYPGPVGFRSEKYVDAQYRDVDVGNEHAFWSFTTSIGSGADRRTHTANNANGIPENLPCVAMSGSAGALWKPTSELGNFSGWDFYNTGWLDSSIYMPMPLPTDVGG